ncbi:hypothetical protein BD413DRAFT_601525 [Trametes elegans]|nr:hypothetical protein BD413DRAFT_601525 [Trametes elegans]
MEAETGDGDLGCWARRGVPGTAALVPLGHSLPIDILLHVALELATIDILGPPRHLPPLFRLCRYVYHTLKANRTALFSRIYRAKFDTHAALRRFGANTITNAVLSVQLVKHTNALKRLRACNMDSDRLTDDLWTAYIMFMENDGKNYAHLMEYAHMDSFIDRYMDSEFLWGRDRNSGWPLDSTPNSLVVWMLWFTMTPERLSNAVGDRLDSYLDKLKPIATVPPMYYPFHAPDLRFDLPDEGSLPEPGEDPTPFGFFPFYRDPAMVVEQIWLYGRVVSIMPPLIGLGAVMVFVMLSEAVPYDPPSILAVDRAHANPADGVRPTQADFIEWASVRGVQFYNPGTWAWLDELSPEQRRLETGVSWRRELQSISAAFDNDWNRLTGCYDPRHELPLKGVVYRFGSMVGSFAGRMQIPDLFRYRDVVQSQNMPELSEFPLLAEQPVYVRFREHHCINPEIPVPTGVAAGGLIDDVQNAYLPESLRYRHIGNSLRVEIPGTRTVTRYEEFVEGRPNSHNPATCRCCIYAEEEKERELRERIAAYHRRADGDTEGAVRDDMAIDEDVDSMDEDSVSRSRRGSMSSHDSDVSHYFGDESESISTRQFRVERDHEVEQLVQELMGEGPPDVYDEYIEHECNGIQDIIITGEVLPRHGAAWHHYRFYGRVRRWDGLIVLVRIPTELPWNMKTIFRGYLIGNQNFVGTWRQYNENSNAIPLEGPFALSRVQEAEPARHVVLAPPPSLPAATVDTHARAQLHVRLTPGAARTFALPRSSMHIPPQTAQAARARPDPRSPGLAATASAGPTQPMSPRESKTTDQLPRASADGRNASHLDPSLEPATPREGTTGPGGPGVRSSSRPSGEPERTVRIYAGRLFDPESLQLLPRRVVTVSQGAGLVLDVQPYGVQDAARDIDASGEDEVVDLRDATVLPGFVDAHVHMFLRPYAEVTWEDQLMKESLVERTVRATIHAKRTLMAGYTTVRDLGTEGAEDADVQLRKCLSGPEPLIPGPRYFCANRAIIASGSYGPKSTLHPHQAGVEGVTGAEFVDGEAECVKAVRRQVGAGADWIKHRRSDSTAMSLPTDYRVRTRIADVSTKIAGADIQTFTGTELRTLVSTARQLGVKVAAHAQTWRAELLPENGGVDTLEHGSNLGADEFIDALKASRVIWVPTLSVFYVTDTEKAPGGRWDRVARNFQRALARGVTNVACGGDTGPFPHGDNALEMKLMVRLGADWRLVLRWATLAGWQCVRSAAWEGAEGAARLARVAELQEAPGIVGDNEVPFGVVRRGFAADIVATRGDLADDFERAVDKASITFVMKGGKVFKRDGRELA